MSKYKKIVVTCFIKSPEQKQALRTALDQADKVLTDKMRKSVFRTDLVIRSARCLAIAHELGLLDLIEYYAEHPEKLKQRVSFERLLHRKAIPSDLDKVPISPDQAFGAHWVVDEKSQPIYGAKNNGE